MSSPGLTFCLSPPASTTVSLSSRAARVSVYKFFVGFGMDHKEIVNHIRGPGNFIMIYTFFLFERVTIVATFGIGFFVSGVC